MQIVDDKKYYKKQKLLFVWTVIAIILFVVAWIAGIYRAHFGFDPHLASNNFVFNLTFLFPATIISLLISYFTAGLVIINWRQLPNKKISIITVLLSFSLIAYVTYNFIMLLRQH